jgi:hypothetical protein
MKRHEILNTLAKLNYGKKYLEIGVARGITFKNIQVESKVAVDPCFKFNTQEVSNGLISFHEKTSDHFFRENLDKDFDLIFLDGLHTFDQTLRDLLSAISITSKTAIIVIDDVCPVDYFSSLPSHREAINCRKIIGSDLRSWMGDVYKLVYFCFYYILDWKFATINESHGQLIMWKSFRDQINKDNKLTLDDIANMNYSDYLLTKDLHFNFKDFANICDEITKDFLK